MKKTAVAVALGAALAVGSIGGASAAPRVTASLSFFEYGGSSAGWVTEADGNKAVALSVEVFGFAGISVNHVDGKAVSAVAAPSFDFLPDAAGASGGSPRLVVGLSDGGRFEVRPLTWTAGWNTVDAGDAGMVDTNGGTCGYRYGQSWAQAQACAGDATVTSVYMVSDSWWINWSSYTTLVDDLQWDGKTIGSAADNRR